MTQPAVREVLRLSLITKEALYAAHMPFIKEGALFIHTRKLHALGEAVWVELNLMDETEQYHLQGEVVWITPPGAQANMEPGIGVRFSGADNVRLQKQITTYLAGMEKSDKRSDTL